MQVISEAVILTTEYKIEIHIFTARLKCVFFSSFFGFIELFAPATCDRNEQRVTRLCKAERGCIL